MRLGGSVQDDGGVTMVQTDTGTRSFEAQDQQQIAPLPLSEIALTGIFEISKILAAPTRLEITLANVVNLLQSFLQMHHGTVLLLEDDGIPGVAVGAGWREGSDERYRARLPRKAIDQIVATAVPLIAESIADHQAFDEVDIVALGATGSARVSFIGVPIRIDQKVVGTLSIDRIWDDRSVFRLEPFSSALISASNGVWPG